MHQFKLRNAILISSLAGAMAMVTTGCSQSDDTTGMQSSSASGSLDATASDTRIRSGIESSLASDSALSASSTDIEVSIANGVVTLAGEVADTAAKTAAERAARAVDGVRSVRNDLTVATRRATSSSDPYGPGAEPGSNELGDAMSDTWITTKVKAELLSDELSSGFEVEVETVDGWVTLRGTLVDREAVDHVRKLVENVDGVRGVDITSLNVVAARSRT